MADTTRSLAPKGALLALLLAALALFTAGQFLLGGGCNRRKEVQSPAPYRLVEAYPTKFNRPLDLRIAPGLLGRLFVVTQDGVIFAIDTAAPSAPPSRWLDLGTLVLRDDNEEGLLGLAFHPDFATNRRAYLYFSRGAPRRNVLAEVTAAPDGLSADIATLRVLLEIEKPFGNHNGGSLVFGNDKRLYVGVGDGGSGGDPNDNAQNLGVLLGKVLRIDVDTQDAGRAYGVASDNPFVTTPGARPEIFAYGVRNPWRMSLDAASGDIWIGDVGQDAWEEIDVLRRGANYGWNRFEGRHRFGSRPVIDGAVFAEPVHEYGHDVGASVTGGVVYRGKAHPSLAGTYVFGDFATKRVWGLRRVGDRLESSRLVDEGCAMAAFGTDPDGEILLACFDGLIRRLDAR